MKSTKQQSFQTVNIVSKIQDNDSLSVHHLGPIKKDTNMLHINKLSSKTKLNSKNEINMINMNDNNKKVYIEHTNITPDLGKYLDTPTPDFHGATRVLEHQRDLLSENLYYMYKDFQNYSDIFNQLKDDNLEMYKKLEKSLKYAIMKIGENENQEERVLAEEVKAMEDINRDIRNINYDSYEMIADYNSRLDRIEKKLGIVVYDRRLKEEANNEKIENNGM